MVHLPAWQGEPPAGCANVAQNSLQSTDVLRMLVQYKKDPLISQYLLVLPYHIEVLKRQNLRKLFLASIFARVQACCWGRSSPCVEEASLSGGNTRDH